MKKEIKDILNNKSTKLNINHIYIKKFFILLCIIGTVCCYILLLMLYGPKNKFRDWLITTAMDTMNHKYLATFFYDDVTIQDSLNRNWISDFNNFTNIEEIVFVDYSKLLDYNKQEDKLYSNKYEYQILEKDINNNDYKIINIKTDKYEGYLAVIYDSSRVDVATTKYLKKDGQYLTTISEENNALIAINGGGFKDSTGHGTGGTPLGITISNGKLIYDGETTSSFSKGGLIGITKDNKLFLGDISARQALSLGIRSSVSFGPYLIINGKSAEISGNGGAGRAPRTAIGQRKDGIMLFLVLDGNRALGNGATYSDVLEIMEKYGAHNAACLDGGASTGMTVNHKFINNPSTQSGINKSRPIPTAFILKNDDSNDGEVNISR